MNVKISTQHKLLAGFWWNDELTFNHYKIKVDMLTVTPDVVEQNIAFLRLRHIVEETLDGAIFINQTETDTIEKFNQANLKLALVPEDPVDQIIGMLLHSKLSAVMEEKILIRSLTVSSVKGDEVEYHHDDIEVNPFYNTAGWWGDRSPDNLQNTGSDDVMQHNLSLIAADRRWRELGLGWDEADDDYEADGGNVLVFGEFKKHED